MSLIKTLAKVAIGVAIAKGVNHVTQNGLPGRSSGSAGTSRSGGGLGDLGNLLGGKASGGISGGLGGLLDGLTGGGTTSRSTSRRSSAPSGLEGLLGGAGGLGGLLGGVLGGASATTRTSSRSTGGLGAMLNDALTGQASPEEPSRDQELAAALMLRAMVQAAKADGVLDAEEKAQLMRALDGAEEAEIAFVNQELAAPVDVDALVRQVPVGMEAQVYAVSLAAIRLDHPSEARYLQDLAQALELDRQEVNDIHRSAGVAPLYA